MKNVSIENETAVNEQELSLEQSEEVVSEQPELVEGQEVATPDTETEQVDETEEREYLAQALAGEAEPEEEGKESKIPRSTAKALRKNKRLEKQLKEQSERLAQLEAAQFNPVQAKAPVRDWDNETDEEYQFKQVQSALQYQEQQRVQQAQFEQQKKQLIEQEKKQTEAVQRYADEVDALGFKNYDDVEANVLDGMHEAALAEMASIDPVATPKILWHLNSNPAKHKELLEASHTDANKFYLLFGELRAKVNDIDARVKSRKRQVSKAPADNALDSGSTGNSLDAQILEAANKGNVKLYQKLKAKKEAMNRT